MDNDSKERKIEWIKQEYLSIPVGAGNRNHGFYIAGLKLSNHMQEFDIRSILMELAGHDQKMINRIDGVIKSVYSKKAA